MPRTELEKRVGCGWARGGSWSIRAQQQASIALFCSPSVFHVKDPRQTKAVLPRRCDMGEKNDHRILGAVCPKLFSRLEKKTGTTDAGDADLAPNQHRPKETRSSTRGRCLIEGQPAPRQRAGLIGRRGKPVVQEYRQFSYQYCNDPAAVPHPPSQRQTTPCVSNETRSSVN